MGFGIWVGSLSTYANKFIFQETFDVIWILETLLSSLNHKSAYYFRGDLDVCACAIYASRFRKLVSLSLPKQIVPQQSSVPASGDFTPVSPAKAICVHCSICAAAHLPQPRPVPDPALSFHCQVSYFQLRPLRTVLYFPKTQTFQSYSSGPIFGKRWNNNWKKKLIYVNQRIRCDHPVTSVIRD